MTQNEPARPAAGAASAPGTSRTGNAVARRGDLVVIHLHHQDWKAWRSPGSTTTSGSGRSPASLAPGWSACSWNWPPRCAPGCSAPPSPPTLVVGEGDGGEHALEVVLCFQQQCLAAVDDGQAALDKLLGQLADTPTPTGPTPRQLGRDDVGLPLLRILPGPPA